MVPAIVYEYVRKEKHITFPEGESFLSSKKFFSSKFWLRDSALLSTPSELLNNVVYKIS